MKVVMLTSMAGHNFSYVPGQEVEVERKAGVAWIKAGIAKKPEKEKGLIMSLVLVTAPAVEPVSLAEAKSHLRVDDTTDDSLITALIVAAREQAEAYTRRALVTQTWDLFLDRFTPVLDLPLPPWQSVTSVTYTDTDGASQTLDSSLYEVDTAAGRIVPAYDESWPDTRTLPNAVTVRFVSGYGLASAVPQTVKQAMLLLIGEMYENREETGSSNLAQLPLTAERLLWPLRVVS